MAALLDEDPGLRRRFPQRLSLPDYSPEELADIAAKVRVTARNMRFHRCVCCLVQLLAQPIL